MGIKEKNLISLIEDVVLKYQSKYLSKYINTSELKTKHDTLLTKFAVMFFYNEDDRLDENFIHLLEFYDELNIPKSEITFAIGKFFRLYKKWLDHKRITSMDYYNKVLRAYQTNFKCYEKTKGGTMDEFIDEMQEEMHDSHEEDDFFFFEDDGVEEEINNMHYQDKDKISAEEYFSENPLTEDDINSIIIQKDILTDILDDYLEYSDRFLEDFQRSLRKLNSVLYFIFSTNEFKDIGFGLEKLTITLDKVHYLEDDTKALLFHLLQTFIEDLIKWLNSVFIEQTAIDIHYLDASLLANASQIEIMLEKDIK